MKLKSIVSSLVGALILLLSSGCSSDGGGGPVVTDGSTTPPVQTDSTAEPGDVTWGQASCQQSNSCENFPLGFSFDQWDSILQQTQASWNSLSPESQTDANKVALHCGAALYQAISDQTNLNRELGNNEMTQLLDFAEAVIEFDSCSVKPNLLESMDNYLAEVVAA